jgi:hypothetical protein
VSSSQWSRSFAIGDFAFGRAVLFMNRTYAVPPPVVFTAVLFLLLYLVFALYERKNKIQIKSEYHAAAGTVVFDSATA